ncbi:dihydrodipicolinate synthase family protein, partial [Lysobacter sp. 2RAB21]
DTTSHFSTRIAAARAKAAADAGAKMLMMMPPYHGALLKADEQGMIEHFKAVTDACGLPVILQDAPLSGVTMTVPFMVRLAKEVPLVRYFKIEV